MTMTNRHNQKRDSFILYTLEELVPQDHLVRKIESCIDFSFIYPKVEGLYSSIGRPSIDPVVLFKMLFINIIFGINSMRKTCEEIKVNIAYRWFLGLNISETIPNYSTWSQNYIRRYKDSEVFDQIFTKILDQAISLGYVDVSTVFGDSTHQKDNANKNKYEDVEVEIVKKAYEDAMLEEINIDRENHGKKPLKETGKREIMFDEETGEVREDVNTKHIKQSKTDPESGCFHKGEKDKCFAYSHHTFCDRNGFVLSNITIPGNVHDSVSFYKAYEQLNQRFRYQIENICLDAGYITPAICKEIISNGHTALMPYKRPMTKKGFFRKYEYVYDEYFDCYICPNNEELKYSTTDKNGYKIYKSNPDKCKNCPFKDKCTQSKNNQKIITRHVWEAYKEYTNGLRYTKLWKELYPKRKETIERVFGDCKELHCLRYTRLRGLKKNSHNATMIFACHNLKKMARWMWKSGLRKPQNNLVFSKLFEIINYYIKKVSSLIFELTLSTV